MRQPTSRTTPSSWNIGAANVKQTYTETQTNYEDNENSTMNLADISDDADVVSFHEPHLLVVFVSATGTKDMGEMETQAVLNSSHGTPWRTRWPRTAKTEKRANQRRNTAQKEKDAGLDQIATLVIPLNCHHTGRFENTGSKAITSRSRDLRWPVTDTSKNLTVPNETVKAHQLTNCPRDPS